ncbi:DUF7283 family protein [Salinigranum sp. GCM10025319]|uniref:DUF7283 family protein n=1 Tax=Salinigranum sp. GCM10025319 TaxID=3252687 RepID=UPI003610BEBA
MFDAPIDAWYVWLGLSVASLAVFGVATSLPTAPVPDTAGVAETIDRVATTEYDTTASRDLDATAVRLGPRRIGLRNDAGAAHATLSYPVVPVRPGTRLARVLHGQPPTAAFPSRAAFERAVESARNRGVRWRPAGDAIHARHLVSGGLDVTLVGTGPANARRGVGVNGTANENRTAPTNPTLDTSAHEEGAGQ